MGNVSGGSLNPAVPWSRNGKGNLFVVQATVWQSSIKHPAGNV